ncbi:unnamed protein product, partial [Mesorhabditis belari]|uniref:RUN domain-containing protein n=1 Tax=Mesorhabditis belari TaxID=2138241 RepID=A0AAF3EVZ9_9BILA
MLQPSKSSEEKRKQDLSKELENVLKAAVGSLRSSKETISSEITQNLCNIIEAILIHGLRDPFFLKGSRYAKYPEPNFWPFVSKFSHPAILSQISALKQIRTEIGKGRAWIRIVLNECAMEHYVTLLKNEATDIQRFYNDNAYLRDGEQVERMRDYLKGMLSRCTIASPTNSSFLNTWTPTPLILAGLVNGKPLRIGQLAPRKKLVSMSEHEEIGMPALDLLPTTSSPQRIRKLRHNVHEHDEDNLSIYSHPSMVDCKGPMSSTPISRSPADRLFDSPNDEAPKILHVERRQKKQRRTGSQSSSSGSNHSPSQSEIGLIDASMPQDSWIDRAPKTLNESPIKKVPQSQSDTVDSGIYEERQHHEKTRKESIVEHLVTATSTDHRENKELDEAFNDSSGLHAIDMSNLSSMHDQTFGSSLHDEMLLVSTTVPLVGNSLIGRAWSIPKTDSCSDFCGTSFGSGSESAGPVMPFGTALRNAMQTDDILHGPNVFSQASKEGAEIALEVDSHVQIIQKVDEMPEIALEVEEEVEEKAPTEEELLKQKAAELLHLFTKVQTEIGLDGQDWRCPQCKRTIGCGYGKWRVCGVDARYYCSDCFSTELRPIPARILLNWDHRPRPVSTRGKVYLDQNADTPLFRLNEMNSMLYDRVNELKKIKNLRERLQAVSLYLFSCRESVSDDLKRRTGLGSGHLLEHLHIYSFQDLLNVFSGALELHLQNLLKFATNHVFTCLLCRQKGFICELCTKDDVIYPFQNETQRCTKCFSVYHDECFQTQKEKCPKCVRRENRGSPNPPQHHQPTQEMPFL